MTLHFTAFLPCISGLFECNVTWTPRYSDLSPVYFLFSRYKQMCRLPSTLAHRFIGTRVEDTNCLFYSYTHYSNKCVDWTWMQIWHKLGNSRCPNSKCDCKAQEVFHKTYQNTFILQSYIVYVLGNIALKLYIYIYIHIYIIPSLHNKITRLLAY